MKYLISTILLTLSIHVTAQNEVSDTLINEVSDTFTGKQSGKGTFVRIYNLDGKKTFSGRIESISNTSIELYSKGNSISIPVSEIGKIRTKQSTGTNIGTGALIGGASGALVGLAQPDDFLFDATDYAVAGLVFGSLIGAAIGGITAIFKNSELYIIDGNERMLKNFKEKLK